MTLVRRSPRLGPLKPSSDEPVIISARGKVGDDTDGYCNPRTYTRISYITQAASSFLIFVVFYPHSYGLSFRILRLRSFLEFMAPHEYVCDFKWSFSPRRPSMFKVKDCVTVIQSCNIRVKLLNHKAPFGAHTQRPWYPAANGDAG